MTALITGGVVLWLLLVIGSILWVQSGRGTKWRAWLLGEKENRWWS